MRSGILSERRGSTSIEKVAMIIILIIFMALAFLILSNVFHFSLFNTGGINPSLTTNPSQCQIGFSNLSTASNLCYYGLSVSGGSPGLTYAFYNNTTGRINSYVVGESTLQINVSLAGHHEVLFVCNTTGSTTAVNGFYYSPGGTAQLALLCG